MISMAYVALVCLVALVTAAPLAEVKSKEEVEVTGNSDHNTADRARGAQKVISVEKQQDGVPQTLSPAEVSNTWDHGASAGQHSASVQDQVEPLGVQHVPDHSPSADPDQLKEPGEFGEIPVIVEGGQQPVQDQEEQNQDQEEQNQDQEVQDQEVQNQDQEVQNQEVQDQEVQDQEVQNQDQEVQDQEVQNQDQEVQDQEVQNQEVQNQDVAQVPVVEGGAATDEVSSEHSKAEQTVQSGDLTSGEQSSLPEEAQVPVTAEQTADDTREAQETGDQPDDVENLLQELRDNKDNTESQKDDTESQKDVTESQKDDTESQKDDTESQGTHSGEEEEGGAEEGSAERELMHLTNEIEDKGVLDIEPKLYTQTLLKYILLNSSDYARGPSSAGFLYPSSYFLQRRRRSLVRRGLPVLHQRHSDRRLARAKRTKRDLLDDDLYYNSLTRYDPRAQQQQQEEEERVELQELIAYLMALYPALSDDQPQDSPFTGSQWPGSSYPEDPVPTYPRWEEPTFEEVPDDWEPEQAAPSWGPSFYPEEEEGDEEASYYPSLAKRQTAGSARTKRYFFPFAQEPYTHWGAFVPSQKRDYDTAYRRLRELALVLADTPPSSPYVSFHGYRRK